MGQPCGTRLEFSVKVVCQLGGYLQEAAFAGGSVVYAGGGHQVSHVVYLVVMRVCVAVFVGELNIGRQITVRLLGFGDDLNPFIHKAVELFILRNGVNVGNGLQPLVAISIAPVCTSMGPLLQTGGDTEIAQLGGVVGVLEGTMHAGNHRLSAKFGFLCPEASRPFYIVHVHAS